MHAHSIELPTVLTAQWRHLVMLNFEIDPGILAGRVPAGTELDFWNGRTYVSIVGFRFLNTRLFRFPIPCHRNFSEVNLRFYVRRRHQNDWRRGVVFIKEIVPLPAVTLVARRLYNENYVTLPMRYQREQIASGEGLHTTLRYSWKSHGHWAEVSASTIGEPAPLESGSESEFITEHYWGYNRQRDGSTMEYEVQHPRWKVWQPISTEFRCDVAALYGPELAKTLASPPTSTLVADGSEIVIRKGTRY